MSVCEWDGSSYDRVSTIQQGLGQQVLGRLELVGDEVVVDAGCGSGKVTQMLADRLPHGKVIAVDRSPSMVQAASERFIDNERVEVRLLDLLELKLEYPVDAVLSTATFHWVSDHEELFACLHSALRPGGKLVAQCGGEGNIDGLRGQAWKVLEREPYAAHFADWRAPWNYANDIDTETRLRAAGFAAVKCWLEPTPREPDEPREFLSTIVLGPHVQHMPAELRESFMDEVLETLGEPVVIDYVRLNMDATK